MIGPSTSTFYFGVIGPLTLTYVPLKDVDGSEVDLPVQLMNAGYNFNDVPEPQSRQRVARDSMDDSMPCTQLLCKVADSNMHRPMVKHRQT